MLWKEPLFNADETYHITDETIICEITAKRYWVQGYNDSTLWNRYSITYRTGEHPQLQ